MCLDLHYIFCGKDEVPWLVFLTLQVGELHFSRYFVLFYIYFSGLQGVCRKNSAFSRTSPAHPQAKNLLTPI